MSSPLRLNPVIDTQSTQSYFPTRTSPTSPPAKKQKMSLTQTYYIASTARSKLGKEASRADHDLRLLVGHANLLDVLMVDLQDAEREQEAWFNESLRKASKPEQPRHVQWIDSIAEEYEEDSDSDSDSDSGSDVYEEDEELDLAPAVPSTYTVTSREIEEDEEDEFQDMEYDEEHALTRVDSHPPELVHEDSSDSEDESLPPSPGASELDFAQYQPTQPIKTTPYKNKMEHDHYLADNIIIQQQSSPMISAY